MILVLGSLVFRIRGFKVRILEVSIEFLVGIFDGLYRVKKCWFIDSLCFNF